MYRVITAAVLVMAWYLLAGVCFGIPIGLQAGTFDPDVSPSLFVLFATIPKTPERNTNSQKKSLTTFSD